MVTLRANDERYSTSIMLAADGIAAQLFRKKPYALVHRLALMMAGVTAEQPPDKKLCSNGGIAKKIGTHDGTFHCDEVLACYMLQQLDQYKNATIIRTRDPAVLAECDIVVDVGGVYDPEKNLFDHHQRSFNETMKSVCGKKWSTKLSSAGLIYCHFGKNVLKTFLGKYKDDESVVTCIYDKIYENFVEEIDAIDNGVDQFDGVPKYHISTNLSTRVGHCNPSWNDEKPNEMECFKKAVKIVEENFQTKVHHFLHVWLPARSIVQDALISRCDIDPSGEIILLRQSCPWKEHLFELEDTEKIVKPIKYVVYGDKSGKWRIQCVPAGRNTFENRLSIVQEWRGLRDEELSKKSGIPDCVFVHATGFIGGNKTQKGVLDMARRCLAQTLS
uniref:UPF0160 protein MYG1, mitochondrial-like n=1 Tax=Phallusia mammillata TaxID=59560 RepID=A0A6F9D7P9_9ASCI|nr:UPF0160 protein MYG1, mitochondrial-like [Phallusia mammillata]